LTSEKIWTRVIFCAYFDLFWICLLSVVYTKNIFGKTHIFFFNGLTTKVLVPPPPWTLVGLFSPIFSIDGKMWFSYLFRGFTPPPPRSRKNVCLPLGSASKTITRHLGDMSPMLWPLWLPPPLALLGDKKRNKYFLLFYINIAWEPVVRRAAVKSAISIKL